MNYAAGKRSLGRLPARSSHSEAEQEFSGKRTFNAIAHARVSRVACSNLLALRVINIPFLRVINRSRQPYLKPFGAHTWAK